MNIDAQCHCQSCETRTKKTYALPAVCINCGAGPFVVTFRKGDKSAFGSLGPQCPNCETYSLKRKYEGRPE